MVHLYLYLLSHGQAQTERGFNVKKDLLVENLQETSLKAQRIVYDHMTGCDQSIEGIEVTSGISLSCKTACSRYKDELAKCKRDDADTSKDTRGNFRKKSMQMLSERKWRKKTVISELEKALERLDNDISSVP